MYITKKLAAEMESCIKQTHIEVTQQYSSGTILEINGGAACFSGCDSYLSQVVAWGFATTTKQLQTEISTIEQFYASLNHTRVDIELCPYVGTPIAEFLSKRGYCITEFNTVSVMDITSYQDKESDNDEYQVRPVKDEEKNEWATKIAHSFDFPEAYEQFSHYIDANGVTTFGVYQNQELLAGSTVALHGTVCDLGVTSTLPHHRGKGLQKEMIRARLNFAKQQGVQLATVTTEPGTISEMNIQKIGFRPAYTRIKMTLELA